MTKRKGDLSDLIETLLTGEAQPQYTQLNCAECGATFWLLNDTYKRRKEDGGTFYCPAGHGNVFSQSENSKLKEEITKLKQEIATHKTKIKHQAEELDLLYDDWRIATAELSHAKRQIAGYKGAISRWKNKDQTNP